MASILSAGTTSATGLVATADTSGVLQLATNNGTTAVTIDASQNVGIGTSSPTPIGTSYATVDIRGTNGSGVGIGSTASGQIGALYAQNSNSCVNLWNQLNSFLTLGTNNTERMRIDASGNLLVGKTSPDSTTLGFEARATGIVNSGVAQSTNIYSTFSAYSTTASAYRFYVGLGGTIYATSTTITAISDQRLKENIRDLDEGLATVLALKPRKFDWKAGKGQDIKNARGFIAQEFEQVLPDMIEEWKDPAPEGEDPYKAINANLIPTLVKAIQELSAQVTALQSDNAALKAKVGI